MTGASRGWRKGLRSLGQSVAGGGFTFLVAAVANGLSPFWAGLLVGGFGALAAYLQNYLEGTGRIRELLPTGALISVAGAGGGGSAVAAVEAVATEGGAVVGDVTDLEGEVVGTVEGQLEPEEPGHP